MIYRRLADQRYRSKGQLKVMQQLTFKLFPGRPRTTFFSTSCFFFGGIFFLKTVGEVYKVLTCGVGLKSGLTVTTVRGSSRKSGNIRRVIH